MIYFDRPTKAALVRRFYDATAPGGYLFIDILKAWIRKAARFPY
ncbi:MAG: hypothetical protein ACLS6H_08895 [Clostridium sp.]